MDFAARRASAISAYARKCDALGEAGRSADAVRASPRPWPPESPGGVKVYLNDDALRGRGWVNVLRSDL
jgi:hypothetical protein